MTKKSFTIADIKDAIGQEVGRSNWRVVTQEMINQFADATDDHQWIHLDAERAAAETPFGGTIAHGFLTLSLLSSLAFEALPELEGTTMGVNYGFESVRFTSPVKSGAKVRAIFVMADANIRRSGRIIFTYDVTLEVENTLNPALTARWQTMMVVDPELVADVV